MGRISYSFFGVLLIVLLVAISLPYRPDVPEYSSVLSSSVSPEQAQHLQLGLFYEHAYLYDDAREEYELAITPQGNEVTSAALSSVRRILDRQKSVRYLLYKSRQSVLNWSGDHAFQIITLLGAIYGLFLLAKFVPHRKGYVLAPFNDFAPESSNGLILPNLIHQEIRNAQQLHSQGQQGIFSLSENVTIPVFGLLSDDAALTDASLNALDVVATNTVNLPVGQVLGVFQRWWNAREFSIGGSVIITGNTIRVIAEKRQARTRKIASTWEIIEEAQENTDQQLFTVAEKMAYILLYNLCSGIEAKSWQSFWRFSKGLRLMERPDWEENVYHSLEEAVSWFEKSLSIDPDHLLVKYNLGICYNNLGRYDDARAIFKEIKDSGSRFYIEATYNLGLAYYHKFQDWAYKLALTEFNDVVAKLQEEGNKDNNTRVLLGLAYCGLSNVYAQMVGRNKDAERYFELTRQNYAKALEIAGDIPEIQASAHSALGIGYLQQKLFADAIQEFSQAIKFKADYPINYAYLADVYQQQNNNKVALDWLEKAIRYNPHYEYAYYKMGLIYKAMGEHDKAFDVLHKASHLANAHNELGKLLAEQQSYDDAIREFRQSLSLNKRQSETLCNIAWYTIEAGKLDAASLQEALTCARQSLQLEQGTAYEWHRRDVLGWVYFNAHQYDEAERELSLAIQKNGYKSQHYYHLALVYRAKGDIDKALALVCQLLDKQEQNIWKERAEALKKELEVVTGG